MTGDRRFPGTCTAIEIGVLTLMPASAPDQGLEFSYTASAQSWTVRGVVPELVFTEAERDTTAPSSTEAYVKVGPPQQWLRIGNAGTTATPAEYFRNVAVRASEFGRMKNFSCVIGVPTLITDRPAGTAINFTSTWLSGFLFRTTPGSSALTQYSTTRTTATFDVNLATGKVTMVMRLTVTTLPSGPGLPNGPDVDLGTVTATADIDPATGGFYGTTWTSSDMTILFPQFSGRFFGPQGRESGFVLTMLAEKPDGSRYYLSGFGAAMR